MSSSYNLPMDDFDSLIDPTGGFDQSNYADENQTFSGPSHEYGQFHQQTGLPSGSMANMSAYNDINMENDFNTPSNYKHSIASSSDMSAYNSGMKFDTDFNQTPQSASYPGFYPPANADDFINPSAVYEPPKPVRMWPGMHTQQALAKQQQQQSQTSHHFVAQQPQFDASQSSKGKARAGSQTTTDPVADRRISEILDNMRHKSHMSPIDENGDASAEELANAKREEEEMDEDERLLASDEGKKLSSKERRQLRNKVSARAFRSRRKEYIGQLEGDLNNKTSEANDLRVFNRKLLEENNQLKNLTRTLLSHPSFQTFLEDMSHNQTFMAGPAPQHLHMPMPEQPTLPSQPEPRRQPQHNEVKQEPEQQQQQHHNQQREQTHVNMARIPDQSLDMSMLNLGNNHWGSQNGGFQFAQPQVFAVFDVPQGPSLEEIRHPLSCTKQTVEPEVASEDTVDASTESLPTSCTRTSEATSNSQAAVSTAPIADYSFAALNRLLDQSMSRHGSPVYSTSRRPTPSTAFSNTKTAEG